MKKKGFTLIELLAVIVVLAIIALIATPLVMNTIKNVKKGAAERSAENYIKGVEIMIIEQRGKGVKVADGLYTVNENGNLCKSGTTCTDDDAYIINVKGDKPAEESTIAIENGIVVAALSSDPESKTLIYTRDEAYTIEFNDKVRLQATEIVKVEPVIPPNECFDFEPIYNYDINYASCMANFETPFDGMFGSGFTEQVCRKDDFAEVDFIRLVEIANVMTRQELENNGLISNVEETNNVIITNYKCGENPSGNSDDQTGTMMDVKIPEKVTIDGQEKNVTAIGGLSFATLNPLAGDSIVDGNRKINSIVIPNTINRMEMAAFYANNLKEVTIPGSIKFIPSGAFQNTDGNGNLKKVKISDGVEKIGNTTFMNNRIKSLELGNSLTSIGNAVFMNNRLTSVTIPSSVTSIGETAFMNNLLASVEIPNTVTSIGNAVFMNNKLTSVTIPSSVTSIGNAAFWFNQLESAIIYKESAESDCIHIIMDNVFGIQSGTHGNDIDFQCVVSP